MGEGRFLLFTADRSRPSDLKKLEETRRAFPGWEHRCCGQQVRPTDRLTDRPGLAQAQLERTWAEKAAGAGNGRWESQADRQAGRTLQGKEQSEGSWEGQDAGPSGEAMLSVWLAREGMRRGPEECEELRLVKFSLNIHRGQTCKQKKMVCRCLGIGIKWIDVG